MIDVAFLPHIPRMKWVCISYYWDISGYIHAYTQVTRTVDFFFIVRNSDLFSAQLIDGLIKFDGENMLSIAYNALN